jgi:hypothetical protein
MSGRVLANVRVHNTSVLPSVRDLHDIGGKREHREELLGFLHIQAMKKIYGE